MRKPKQKHFWKYVFLVLFCLLFLFSISWFYLTHPTKMNFLFAEQSLYFLAIAFFVFLYLKLERTNPPFSLTLGFYLIILGFWGLFLETVTTSRVRFLGMPLHLLFCNVGAITFFVSVSFYLRKEENLRKELQKTRKLLDFILQYIPDHIYIKDRQSRFVSASTSLARHFGLQKEEELLGKSDFDFFSDPHARQAFADEQEVMEKGFSIVGKAEEETWPDGRKNWVLTSKIPWRNEEGEVIGVIGISRDITPIVEQRRALEENERFLSAIFENIQDGLLVLDWELHVIRANRFLEEMYSEQKPLAGKKCHQVFHGKDHPCPDCPALRAIKTGKREVTTVPYIRSGQQVGWLEVISSPLQDANGVIQGVIEQVRNVTERVYYEEELKTREENFRLLAEANPSAILIYQDNRFVYANTEAERLSGYSREELIGMPVTQFVHPDFVPVVMERAERRQRNLPVEKQYEIKIVTKTGEERWVFLSAETILYRGRWAGLVSAMDVTEKKMAEERNRHLKMVLESIRNVNQILSREKEPSTLFEKVCQEMVQRGAYPSVLIHLSSGENQSVFHAGIEQEKLLEWMTFLKRETPLSPGVVHFVPSPHFLSPTQGLLATPIRYGEHRFGTLMVAISSKLAQDREEQDLLLELSDDLAFSIYNLELQKARKTIQKSLEESEKRLRTLVENLPLGVAIFRNRQFVYTNPFADRLMDRFSEPLLSFLQEKITPHQSTSALNFLALEDEVRLRSGDGEERWFFIRGRPIQYEAEHSLILFLLDTTEKKKNEAVVHYLATHDTLTGLHNRSSFEEEMRKIDRKENLPVSIVMGDLNGLKLVNDAFGHEEGDRLLREAALLLREACPSEGIVARYGGDEFVILLPRTDHRKTQEIVETIYSRFSHQNTKPIPVSISLGFGTKNNSSQSIYDTLRIAENWMYQRKLVDGLSFRTQTFRFLQKTLREVAYEVEEHSQRIKGWALQMAEFLHLSENEKEMLSLLTDFHDVGKIAIPQEILRKPGPLSAEEWEIVRRHPEIGFRITQAIPDLASIAQLVLAHHEWYNGQGYPRGLKGDEIPLLSRLIAICDAFDVMQSGRPYKKALSTKEAVHELRRCSGTQFDPQLVEAFIEVFNSQTLW